MRAARVNAAAGLMLAAAALPVAAQTVTLEPSAAMRCLTPAAEQRGAPEYPFDAWKFEQKGRVLVALSFTAPDKRPAVKVLASEGEGDSEDAFVEAVKRHVASYRVPCMNEAAGFPARLELEFVFSPNTRAVQSSDPVDPGVARRRELLKCVAHASGQKSPAYPRNALRDEVQGQVLARLHFNSKDEAPQAQVLARPIARPLSKAVADFVSGYRMPCFDGTEPIDTTFTFSFRIDGMGARGLKPLDLAALLGHVRGIQQQALQLDTTTMACPFELRFQYRQPHLPNLLGEVDKSDAMRRPLLNWLASQHLDLPAPALDAIFGDDTVIAVPCAKIDLKPKETS